jgi:hypothetical protein
MTSPLFHDTLKIAAELPTGDPTRRDLLAALLTTAALPKVPGIGPRVLAGMVEKAKANVVCGLTDAYGSCGDLGSEWIAEWKSTAIGSLNHNIQGEYYSVEEATFVSAHNSGSVDVHDHWHLLTAAHRKKANLKAAARAVADAIKGTWAASAWFGWDERWAAVKKSGETFDSEGEAFMRWGVEGYKSEYGFHVAEFPITIRVKRVSTRKDGTFRVNASFST